MRVDCILLKYVREISPPKGILDLGDRGSLTIIDILQSNLVISNSLIWNYRLSRIKNLAPALT